MLSELMYFELEINEAKYFQQYLLIKNNLIVLNVSLKNKKISKILMRNY
jgi:hypothetical protein